MQRLLLAATEVTATEKERGNARKGHTDKVSAMQLIVPDPADVSIWHKRTNLKRGSQRIRLGALLWAIIADPWALVRLRPNHFQPFVRVSLGSRTSLAISYGLHTD